ncbi:MAG: peptidylprolyl isomerase [Lautropia sp.]
MARGPQQPALQARATARLKHGPGRSTPAAIAIAAALAASAVAAALLPLPLAAEPGGQPVLDDATLAREYRDYVDSIRGMRRYRVSYIRVADETTARDLIARVRSGADFAELARTRSIHAESAAAGGDLGSHASCRWAKATLAMLDSLKPRQVHPQPVKGTHGWGVYRLESVTDIEPRSFETYKAELLSGRFEPECPWVPPVSVGVAK